ncbi:MAG: hypothetical protein ACQGVC_24455 [Myxococcota bacterium]
MSLVALVLASCLSPRAAGEDRLPVRVITGDATALRSLGRDLAAILPGPGAGAAIGIVHDEQTTLTLVGSPDLSANTLFEFGSVTKIVTTQLGGA